MSLSNTSLPKPKDWQDFERKTRELFACVLADPNTQQNGRSGQQQHGVDVFGYRTPDCLVGVQCKKKYEKEVTDKELRSEVDKAKEFEPELSEFILITTASRDQKIQKAARLITEELKETEQPFHVSVWGWEDIEDHASQHEKAWKAFDPTWSPFVEQGLAEIRLEISELKSTIETQTETTRPSSSSSTILVQDEIDENTPRHGQITAFQQMTNVGHARAALEQLLKLKDEEWSDASPSERYRILVAIASAKLKLGDFDHAGKLLLDAYNECPTHKNAQNNKATGYLITGEYGKAETLARDLLTEDNSNAEAAGILIQAKNDSTECTNPLESIPDILYETEEVFIAYIHFLRCRDDLEWIEIAKKASQLHPDSKILKQNAAEAVLSQLIETDCNAIAGGIFKHTNYAELEGAVQTLHSEARDALEKDYALLSSTAHNAALALRFTGDIANAKEILGAAIKQHPNDEHLRFQRALIAYKEYDAECVLELIPSSPSNPEAFVVKADTLLQTGKIDDAISFIDDVDIGELPDHIKTGLLTIRVRAYLKRKENQLAINTIEQHLVDHPNNLPLKILKIETYRLTGNIDTAKQELEKTYSLIDDQTDLPSRLELSFEARKLNHEDIIVDLLKGHVATDRDNEGLQSLIAAAINAKLWISAREILDSISDELKNDEWYLRANAILALQTGDSTAEGIINQYLKLYPHNLEMVLARIGIWQRDGRDKDVRKYLNAISLTDVEGPPENRIKLAALICHYGNAPRGLEYGYSTLMDHWDNPKAHLFYHGLIFQNDNIGDAFPDARQVSENTAVCFRSEGKERLYRIEKTQYTFFNDERLDPESDLATLLMGKKEGETFKLQDSFASKPVEILWIKPVYLDAFHRSMDQFNERFPRANGLLKFTYDPDTADPMEDMRTIVKTCAETDQKLLQDYRSKGIPLSFVASLIGKDPLDAWSGLSSIDIDFLVCHGTRQEREQAFKTIHEHNAKGCVLDAITLSIVRRLGVEYAVRTICGPIHTPQSVFDLLTSRAIEAKYSIGKKQGFLSWRDEQLVFDEYTDEFLEGVAKEREKELSWAKKSAGVVPAIPKKDFSKDTRILIDIVGSAATDPAVAADGNELLLLSDDMGLRNWSTTNFEVSTTWLQPVLILARDAGHITQDEYCEAINMLALSYYAYTSLDSHCLMHQARKDHFIVSTELSRLFATVGGLKADLYANSVVLCTFLDELWTEYPEQQKILKIASEVFHAFTKGRPEDQRQLIQLLLRRIKKENNFMSKHALEWLIGHSIGMPYFNDLLQLHKKSKE